MNGVDTSPPPKAGAPVAAVVVATSEGVSLIEADGRMYRSDSPQARVMLSQSSAGKVKEEEEEDDDNASETREPVPELVDINNGPRAQIAAAAATGKPVDVPEGLGEMFPNADEAAGRKMALRQLAKIKRTETKPLTVCCGRVQLMTLINVAVFVVAIAVYTGVVGNNGNVFTRGLRTITSTIVESHRWLLFGHLWRLPRAPGEELRPPVLPPKWALHDAESYSRSRGTESANVTLVAQSQLESGILGVVKDDPNPITLIRVLAELRGHLDADDGLVFICMHHLRHPLQPLSYRVCALRLQDDLAMVITLVNPEIKGYSERGQVGLERSLACSGAAAAAGVIPKHRKDAILLRWYAHRAESWIKGLFEHPDEAAALQWMADELNGRYDCDSLQQQQQQQQDGGGDDDEEKEGNNKGHI